MDEKEDPAPEYLTGYNQGYTIAKHMPELAEKLSRIESITPQLSGIKEGIEQFEREQLKERLPDWISRDRFTQLDKESDLNKENEKDDLEREFD